jgi:hypothetical protein
MTDIWVYLGGLVALAVHSFMGISLGGVFRESKKATFEGFEEIAAVGFAIVVCSAVKWAGVFVYSVFLQ